MGEDVLMAFAHRTPDKSRALTVTAVAALHGVALYALITGLGVEYVQKVTTVLIGKNIPLEMPPPSPTPEPVNTPTDVQSVVTRTINPIAKVSPEAVPINDRVPIVALPQIGDIIIDIPGPTASATAEPQAFPPRSARPRNNPAQWVSTIDYPSAALRRGDQGLVRFELSVGTDGKATSCRVTAASGAPELDAATCKLVTQRARFEPAMDSTGVKVSGAYTGSIRWVIPHD